MAQRSAHSSPLLSFRFFGGRTAPARGRTAPARGHVAATVLKMATGPDANMSRIVSLIEGDPVFARQVRRSAMDRMGEQGRVRSIRDAVCLMGLAQLVRLARAHAPSRRRGLSHVGF